MGKNSEEREGLEACSQATSGIVERTKRDALENHPREKGETRQGERSVFSRGVIFTRARVSLALLSLRKNGGLLVVYI